MSNPYKRKSKNLAPAFIIASLSVVAVNNVASASGDDALPNPFLITQSNNAVNPFLISQPNKAVNPFLITAEEDLPVGNGSGA